MALRVGYVVSRFPKLSETFIVDEIDALERRGTRVELFAFMRGREPWVQAASKPLAERAQHPRWGGLGDVAALLRWLLRRPLRLCDVLWTVAVEHAGSPRMGARALVAVAHGAGFALAMERAGVQHVHAHWATWTATCAWVVHRLTGLPYSFTAHADDIFVARPMLARKVEDAAFVVTIADFTRRWLVDRVSPAAAARVEVVHCGLDVSQFTPAPPPDGGRLEIACVARLEPKKGLLHLVDACRVLRDEGVDFRCRIAGEGRQRGALEARIREHALFDRVELLGAQPREVVRALLLESHVMALPAVVDAEGRADGIPVALMEAQALGRACVATPVSGIPELIEDGRNGLLVAPGDAPALAAALARLAADRALCERLGAEGPRRVRAGFDIDGSAERLQRLMTASARQSAAVVAQAAGARPRVQPEGRAS